MKVVEAKNCTTTQPNNRKRRRAGPAFTTSSVMPTKGNRTGSSAQLRSHSRSSSATRINANLQFTQKDNASTKGYDKGKRNPHAIHEVGSLAQDPSRVLVRDTGFGLLTECNLLSLFSRVEGQVSRGLVAVNVCH